MEQNSFFSGTIDCIAIQAQANAHLQNFLFGEPIMLKTT